MLISYATACMNAMFGKKKNEINYRVDLTKRKTPLRGYAMGDHDSDDNQYLLHNIKAYAVVFKLTNCV